MKSKKRSISISAVSVVIAVVGLAIANYLFLHFQNNHPQNLVWVADETVNAPTDLIKYLKSRDDCNEYRGTDSPKGVTLSAIYQVVQEKYAKIALGCSTNLDQGFPVIKQNGQWALFSGAEYYVNIKGYTTDEEYTTLPRCSIIDKYRISKEFEESCIEDKGKNRSNFTDQDIRTVTYP